MGDEFDPRHAALQHAASVEAYGRELGSDCLRMPARQSDALHAVVCGLIYVGDQVARLAEAFDPPTGHTQPTASKHYAHERCSPYNEGAGQVRAR